MKKSLALFLGALSFLFAAMLSAEETSEPVFGTGQTPEAALADAKRNVMIRTLLKGAEKERAVIEKTAITRITPEFVTEYADLITDCQVATELPPCKSDGDHIVSISATVDEQKLMNALLFFDPEQPQKIQVPTGGYFEKERAEMTAYLLRLMQDYIKIWTITGREILPTVTRKGDPELSLNFWIQTTPQKYNAYLEHLDSSLQKVGIVSAKDGNWDTHIGLRIIPDPPANKMNPWKYWWIPRGQIMPIEKIKEMFSEYYFLLEIELLTDRNEVVCKKIIYTNQYKNNIPLPMAPGELHPGFQLAPLNEKFNYDKTTLRSRFNIKLTELPQDTAIGAIKEIRTRTRFVRRSADDTELKQHLQDGFTISGDWLKR